MASDASPTTATDDGDHLNTNKTTTVTENSEGRTSTTSTTMALEQQKNDKRSRRVSFAEMTSVHFFDRDEFNETPSDGSPKLSSGDVGEGLVFQKLIDSRDDEQVEGDNDRFDGTEDDDDEDEGRRSFFRPMESPSPGSNIGSATSNDEDNFFGPVSASFIRPGRLSDSAASDENHDITMDSTAFSMHFRSLARSDSGLDMKTPTGVHLSFEDKTPTRTTTENHMIFTEVKKPICHSLVPVANVSGSSDSSDMSLVGETSRRYDFDRLPTEVHNIDELVAKSSKDLHIVPSKSPEKQNNPMESKVYQSTDQENGLVELSIDQKQDSGTDLVNGIVEDKVPHKKLDIAHIGSPFPRTLDTPASNLSLDNPISPNQDISVDKSKKSVEKPSNLSTILNPLPLQTLDNELIQLTGNTLQECETPFQGLISHSPAKQKNTFNSFVTPSRYPLMVTPPPQQIMLHHDSESSIQRSISKLQKLQASASSSYLKSKVNSPYIHQLESSKAFHANSLLMRSNDNLQKNQVFNEKLHLSGHKGEVKSINMRDNVMKANQSMKLTPRTGSASQKTLLGKRKVNNYSVSEDLIGKLGTELTRTEEIFVPVTEMNGIGGSYVGDKGINREEILLLSHEKGQVGHSMSLDRNPRSKLSSSRVKSNISGGKLGVALSASKGLIDSGLQKNLLESFEQSPSREELNEPKDNFTFRPSNLEDLVSPRSLQLMEMFKKSSARKRRIDDVAIMNTESTNVDTLIHKSPKVQKIGNNDAETSGISKEVCKEAPISNCELQKWTDIYSKIMEDAEKVLFPSFEKLNLHTVDLMDDILSQQLRSKTYRILCDGLLPQSCNSDNGRVDETRLLLHRIMYEKAKSQLMRTKREKLQEKVEQLRHGLQECQILKSNPLLQQSINLPKVDSIKKNEKQVPCDKVTTMTQNLEASESKISNLIQTLNLSCKVKGEHSCSDTINIVNDHLMKKTCCRFIRMDMQMWNIHDIDSKNGHRVFILNYFDFITQRLEVSIGPVSSIIITNKFNEADISKKFPNMEVCTAFAFVLHPESTKKYVGVRSLAQETQVTSSLVSNLVDVIKEVQLAQLELQNLTMINFHSESAEQLALQVCFFNFKSGKKVTLNLDVSCLKRWLYPSESFPWIVQGTDSVKKDSFPEQVLNEIKDAVRNVRGGYMRILRVCKCISHVVQGLGV